MKKLTLFILIVVVVVYTLIGGAIFHALEGSNESETKTTTTTTYQNFASTITTCATTSQLETFVRAIISAYDQGIFVTSSESSASQWDYGNSVFFAMTAVTTIGYGNQTPVTSGGRAFVCIFAIIGIPLMAAILAGIGEKIGNLLKPVKEKPWIKDHERIDKILKTITISFIGFVAFIFIPAAIFSAIEDWSYGEGIYYGIITLTTIGFGDFVIGTGDKDYRIPYRLTSTIWIVLGLSWVALLLGTVQEFYQDVTIEIEKKTTKHEDKDNKQEELQDMEKGTEEKPTNVN